MGDEAVTSHPAVTASLASWREARAAFQDYLEAQYANALEATCGNLLNARGRAAGKDSMGLFLGPRYQANAYASPELLEWWDTHGRLTFQDWEDQSGLFPGRSWGDAIRDHSDEQEAHR